MESCVNNQQYISIKELHNSGYSNYKIRQMIHAGHLANVNRKWLENEYYTGETNDFYAVRIHAEKGVICLISAAIYYGLSNERSSKIDVAIPRNVKTPQSPSYPPMRFYRMAEQRYRTGIVTIQEGNNSFVIYDREKTVCDVIYHRNKMGLEPAIEVLRRYLKQPDRNINRLLSYAKILHVEQTIRQYLEALL